MPLGTNGCQGAQAKIDPNLPPVQLHCDKIDAGCPPDKGAYTGAGLGSAGIPRWTILRYALNAIPYVGNVIASLALPNPSNMAAVIASQEDVEAATTVALGANLAVNQSLAIAVNRFFDVAVGTSRTPGYITTCAQMVAQDLNEKLTLITINSVFLVVMLIAIVWSLA
jgi:hypothetical protein